MQPKLTLIFIFPLLSLWFGAVTGTGQTIRSGNNEIEYPRSSFVVMSDLHFYDSSLGVSGAALQYYLDHDRKLLLESEELLDAALNEISALQVDFVIISGDMSKDGERINHLQVAQKLRKLAQAGKKIYVIPGNHDISNSHAVRFVGNETEPVPTISALEFATIYREFGFEEALERDPDSLSYLVEPVPGLWLLALDSTRSRENESDEDPIIEGVLYDQTLTWIDSVLEKARVQKKAVIVTLHHGIMEHYPANEKFYARYLLDNHQAVAEKLARAGIKLVFTGHFHAQDITLKTLEDSGQTIYDIETGSLVTAPCPYRVVKITGNQQAVIESRFITAIPSHPNDFQDYAATYLYEGTKKLADNKLEGYFVSEHDRNLINPQASRAFSTHLVGDEVKPVPVLKKEDLGLWGRFIVFMQEKLIEGWYTDLPPRDNELIIELTK